MIDQIIRVDQAGEYGACCLYEGKLKALGQNHKDSNLLSAMLEQEREHLKAFNEKVVMEGVRPSLLQPLWHLGGFGLGYLSAKISPFTAHAVTMAVEDVIQDHYQEQEDLLKDHPQHQELREMISQFKEDEKNHEEEAREAGGELSPAFHFVYNATKNLTKFAIELAKKI